MKDMKELLTEILLKKAKGYSFREKTEEYNVVDGTPTLVKKKVVTKRVQPDVAAVKALLTISDGQTDVTKMTDEQLHVEKLRLLQMLNMCESESVETIDEETSV